LRPGGAKEGPPPPSDLILQRKQDRGLQGVLGGGISRRSKGEKGVKKKKMNGGKAKSSQNVRPSWEGSLNSSNWKGQSGETNVVKKRVEVKKPTFNKGKGRKPPGQSKHRLGEGKGKRKGRCRRLGGTPKGNGGGGWEGGKDSAMDRGRRWSGETAGGGKRH